MNGNQGSQTDKLIAVISPWVAPLGYEIVHLEVQTHRQKTLRLFIDFPNGEQRVGIEDCVKVSRALEEPLDQIKEIDDVFHGTYELEVSSPGVDRPLRAARDYERFAGKEVRIHVYRPLTAEELGNADYQTRNPKQKNFLGRLKGLAGSQHDQVLLEIRSDGSQDAPGSKKKSKKAKTTATESAQEVLIPLPLISKANLEPHFEIGDGED